jgi:biotin synthase
MCYAIPGRVVAIDGKTLTIDYYGEKKKAYNEVSGIAVGNYVYAQGGYVIARVSEEEALTTLEIWKDLFFELQDTDVSLSKLDLSGTGVDRRVVGILDRASQGLPLQDGEMLSLLRLKDRESLELLYKTANFLRQKHLSNSCCVHGIIEYTSYCTSDCLYCGIAAGVRSVKRYRMSRGEVLSAVDEAVNTYGFKALVLQGGEDPQWDGGELAETVRAIKEKYAVLIFVSPGEVGIDGLQKLWDAGARGLLMRFETSNPELYGKIHPGQQLSDRLLHLEEALRMGYLIVTGGLIGLPGQTEEDILADILLARRLRAEMYSFGPYIPLPEPRLSGTSAVDTDLILKTLAVARIADPENAKILVTTGFETFDAGARRKGLMAGANSVMLNVTPGRYKEDYSIYPNRAHVKEPLSAQIESTLSLLQGIGRAPTDLGVSEGLPSRSGF